jgi:ferredoxin
MTDAGHENACGPADSAATHTVSFEDGGVAFTASADEPILQAALRAGVALPSSCRNGTCRTCMCQLASGEVAYRIRWPGLLSEEKEAGWILPCIAYARSDLVLRRERLRLDWRDRRDGTVPPAGQ